MNFKRNQMILALIVFVMIVLVALLVLKCMKKKEKFSESNKKQLIFFKANWCGHCQRFKPVWDSFVHECTTTNVFDNVEFVELDIDKEETKPIMSKHNVNGFPHVVLAEESKDDVVFNKDRNIEALKEFLKMYA